MTPWLPITTAPKDHRPILLRFPRATGLNRFQVGSWNEGKWETANGARHTEDSIDGWQPIFDKGDLGALERPEDIPEGSVSYLQQAAQAAQTFLPDNSAFILFTTILSTEDPQLRYISNLSRADAIAVLKEWLFIQGERENWMKHIR